jgi:phage terminase large subunit-like protein
MWWAAYGYSKFIIAFASKTEQAEDHLENFSRALKNPANKALRQDFPELVTARQDRKGLYEARSGFVFKAKGMDTDIAGAKHGDDRPDTLLLDDIESSESNYSEYQVRQRLTTLTDDVFELNTEARVGWSGTTTRPGSMVHQLIKFNNLMRQADADNVPRDQVDVPTELEWVGLERIQVHHALPILTNEDGTERSFWPTNPKFELEWMLERRHTRNFKKNYLNDPMAVDSQYWAPETFQYDMFDCTKTVLSIDGAVTTNRKSDYTGLAVVGYCPPPKSNRQAGSELGYCLVKNATAVKLKGADLRNEVRKLLQMHPEISGILVETNQGGDLWKEVLHNLPVPIRTVHNTEKKETRAERALNFYQLPPGHVFHAGKLPALEEQMCAFPGGPNDDMVDAVVNAILMYLRPVRRRKSGARKRTPR